MPIDSIRSALVFWAAKRCRRARSAKGLAQLTTSLAAFISNSRPEAQGSRARNRVSKSARNRLSSRCLGCCGQRSLMVRGAAVRRKV